VTLKDDLLIAIADKLKWIIVGSGPSPRPEADRRVLLAWIERGVDALVRGDDKDMDGRLLIGVFNGDFTVDVVDGEARYKLTEAGHQLANDALLHDPDMRRFYQSLAGGAAVDGPEKPQ
jgi:hypothetical protein